MQDHNLPFPRGQTFADGILTMTDQFHVAQEGRVYEVDDTVHGTGEKVKLRVVKNDTGAAITVTRDLCEFSKNALDFGRRIGFFGPAMTAQGVVCKPMDDAYALGKVIAADDLFYVVESGPCTVVTEVGVVAVTPGMAVAANAAGGIDGARAAAGFYIIGTSDALCLLASTNVVIHVNEGLDNRGA